MRNRSRALAVHCAQFTLLAIEALSYAGKSVSNSELGMRTTCSGANCQIGSLPRAESREVRKPRETLGKAAFSVCGTDVASRIGDLVLLPL